VVTIRPGYPPEEKAQNAVLSAQQQFLFCEQSAQNRGVPRNRSVKTNGERYLQDILWKESLLAVKVSTECQTVEELISRLQEKLPQNSAVTRQRNTSTVSCGSSNSGGW
jgi:hypothetical protein